MDWMFDVLFLVGARDFSFLHSIHTGSGAHPASSSVGSGAIASRYNINKEDTNAQSGQVDDA
jgi:hypothetical protein